MLPIDKWACPSIEIVEIQQQWHAEIQLLRYRLDHLQQQKSIHKTTLAIQ